VSFLDTLTDPQAPDRHVTQYYEMFGCRAIYHDGWKAVVYHPIQDDRPGLDRAPWELYDLRTDPTECDDRAAAEPERLASMIEAWWVEAARHQVLPLDNRPFSDLVLERPGGVRPRRRYVYHPHTAMTPEAAAVNVRNRPHVVRASIDVPPGGARGVIISQGSVLGGWALYLTDDGRPCYVHNLCGREQHRVASPIAAAPGRHRVELDYGHVAAAPKRAELLVDGAVVAAADIPTFTWSRFSLTGAGLCCGWSMAPAVADDVVAPARFTGGLDPVVVEVDGDPVVDPIAEAIDVITSQ
jgi:arylsulfatase